MEYKFKIGERIDKCCDCLAFHDGDSCFLDFTKELTFKNYSEKKPEWCPLIEIIEDNKTNVLKDE